jgi:hypothetical protein
MIPDFGEHYRFHWDDLGDIELGRPNLGQQMPVTVYRLAQYTMREALAQRYGDEQAGEVLREAGWIAGREFCLHMLDRTQPLNPFIAELQGRLKEHGIGVLRVERADADRLVFTLTVSDEGFIAGIFHAYTGRGFSAREVDCWATGDRTCRFEVTPDPVAA